VYGENVVSLAGPAWRVHRRIAARAFSQKTIELVHEETRHQVLQMMSAWEENMIGDSLVVEE